MSDWVEAHGKFVLGRQLSLLGLAAGRVFGHAQVVEDQARIALQTTEGGGDGIRGDGLDQADGEASQSGDVLRAEAGADGAAVLIEAPIDDPMTTVLDAPVAAVEGEYTRGVGSLWGMAGDAVDALKGGFAGALVDDVALDAEGLADAWEVKVVVERRGGPDAPGLDAAMSALGSLLELRCAGLRKGEAQVGEQIRLVVLDGEDVGGPRSRR